MYNPRAAVPGASTEYATHRPFGENAADGGCVDSIPATSVTFFSGNDSAATVYVGPFATLKSNVFPSVDHDSGA